MSTSQDLRNILFNHASNLILYIYIYYYNCLIVIDHKLVYITEHN